VLCDWGGKRAWVEKWNTDSTQRARDDTTQHHVTSPLPLSNQPSQRMTSPGMGEMKVRNELH